MKKKISILTILILILSILIYFILSKNNFFKSEDINQNKDLTKIILSNKSICEKCPNGVKEVQLEKKGKKWYVNNKYNANINQINILLETIKKMTIKRPVGVNERSNILKRLDTQRTKVELIKNSDTIKTILVGGNTADQLGTYMIIKDSLNNEPYVFHIDGFNGYLNSRFSCEESNWIDKTIFNLSKKEISKIELNYLDDNNKSFWIEKSNSSKIILKTNNDILTKIDSSFSLNYFKNFEKIYCEKILNNNSNFNVKDIIKRRPFFEIKITLESDSILLLKGIRKKSSERGRTMNSKYDTERFYGYIDSTLLLIQYQKFDKILMSLNDFLIEN